MVHWPDPPHTSHFTLGSVTMTCIAQCLSFSHTLAVPVERAFQRAETHLPVITRWLKGSKSRLDTLVAYGHSVGTGRRHECRHGTHECVRHLIEPSVRKAGYVQYCSVKWGRPSPVVACHTSRSEEHTSELQSLRHLVCR